MVDSVIVKVGQSLSKKKKTKVGHSIIIMIISLVFYIYYGLVREIMYIYALYYVF